MRAVPLPSIALLVSFFPLVIGCGGEPVGVVAESLINALEAHGDGSDLGHDDVTILLVEFRPGPRGPALWHVLRNRLLPQRRS